MSHLVYITLYGETDGVILSRLDCTLVSESSLAPTTINIHEATKLKLQLLWLTSHKLKPTLLKAFENWALFKEKIVTGEPVEYEKQPLQIQDFRKLTN
jgi:hypothetical protein